MGFSPGKDIFGGGKAGKILDPVYMLMGDGPQSSEVLKDLQKKQVERAEKQWELSKPLMTEAARQVGQQQKTGTARGLPIVEDVVAGQKAAASNAQQRTLANMRRAGTQDPSNNRLLETLSRETSANINAIGPRLAAPVVSAGMSGALGGPGLAASSYRGAMQTLSPKTPPTNWAGLGMQAGKLFAGGDMGGFGGGGGKGGGATSNAWQVGGPTSILGGGQAASAPGIVLEF